MCAQVANLRRIIVFPSTEHLDMNDRGIGSVDIVKLDPSDATGCPANFPILYVAERWLFSLKHGC